MELKNCDFLLKPFHAAIQSLPNCVSNSCNSLRITPTSSKRKETVTNEFVTFKEINIVMGQLGLQHCCGHDEGIDILSVFDDEDPSLGEVKMAFDVFDENSDGFIDEFELQRMLSKFGHPEKAKLEECRYMIKGFDVNGDGLIDFDEFVRLMETCSF